MITTQDQLTGAPAGAMVLHTGDMPMLYTKQPNGTWSGDKVNSFQRGLTPKHFASSIRAGLLSWSDGKVVLIKKGRQ